MKYPVKRKVEDENSRGIWLDGDALFPPSPDPIFHDFRSHGETVSISPALEPDQEEETRYWLFQDAGVMHPGDLVCCDNNLPQRSASSGYGFAGYPDVVELKFKPKKRKKPGIPASVIYFGNFYIVSSRILEIFQQFDPEAIDYRPVVMRDLQGNIYDDDHVLLDVTRCIKAVDYANSSIKYGGMDNARMQEMYKGVDAVLSRLSKGKYTANVLGFRAVRLLDDINPDYHIFRQLHPVWGGGDGILISEEVRRSLKAAKPAFRNLEIRHPRWGLR